MKKWLFILGLIISYQIYAFKKIPSSYYNCLIYSIESELTTIKVPVLSLKEAENITQTLVNQLIRMRKIPRNSEFRCKFYE